MTSTGQFRNDSMNNMGLTETTTAGQYSTHNDKSALLFTANPQYNKTSHTNLIDDGNIFDQAFSHDGESLSRPLQTKKKRGQTAQGYGKRNKGIVISQTAI